MTDYDPMIGDSRRQATRGGGELGAVVAPSGALRGLALALAPALVLAGCQPAPTAAAKLPPVVEAQTVSLVPYAPSVTLTGVVAAADTINHAFRISGRAASRLVEVGERVEAGALLAELDSVEQQADLRGAEAGLIAARAQLVQAQSNFARQEELLGRGVITRRVHDQAQEALQMAQSSVQIAEAQLASAQEALSQTQLRAKADGIVLSYNLELGQIVQAAQTVISIAADGDRDAVFNVEEALAAAYAEPPRVELSRLDRPGTVAAGVIREISPAVDARTGTVRVKVAISDTPAAFALGTPVAGTVSGAPSPAIVLPFRALIEAGDGPAVWVVDPELHTVAARPVAVKAYASDAIILSGGVDAGEIVVTSGAHLLKPGQPVPLREQTP